MTPALIDKNYFKEINSLLNAQGGPIKKNTECRKKTLL
jgi:hypothetical protein